MENEQGGAEAGGDGGDVDTPDYLPNVEEIGDEEEMLVEVDACARGSEEVESISASDSDSVSSDSSVESVHEKERNYSAMKKDIEDLEKAVENVEVSEEPRVRHEILPFSQPQVEPLPNDVREDDEIEIVGVVLNKHESSNLLVVGAKSIEGKTIVPVDLDSVICTKERRLLGRVEEVFGPVVKPFYAVRLIRVESAVSGEFTPYIGVDDEVYVLKRHGKYVNVAALDSRGSDASNTFDEEIEDHDEGEFSDDDKEQIAKQKAKFRRHHPDFDPKAMFVIPSGKRSVRGRNQSERRGRGRGGGGGRRPRTFFGGSAFQGQNKASYTYTARNQGFDPFNGYQAPRQGFAGYPRPLQPSPFGFQHAMMPPPPPPPPGMPYFPQFPQLQPQTPFYHHYWQQTNNKK